jgi:hypothetical protein
MPEPHSSVVVGALAGAGVSSATIFLGAQIDALIIGLIAAIFVSVWLQAIDSKLKACCAVMLSAMLAGYGSPVAAQWVVGSVASVSNTDALRLLLALLIGIAAPSIVPIALRWAGNKVQGDQP